MTIVRGQLGEERRGGVLRGLASGWQFLRRWPVFPGAVLIALVFFGVFAPVVATQDPRAGGVRDRHIPPAWLDGGSTKHLLGTDHVGRDVFSRMVHGARISLTIVAVASISGFFVGTGLGLIAGYVGGVLDEIITRLVDIWQALPFLLVALVVVIIYGQSYRNLLILLGVLAWVNFVRVIRAQTLVLKTLDYVDMARAMGASDIRILLRHLLPGVMNTAIVILTLQVGGLILAEATLSFLGAGIPSPTPAWGVMVAEGRKYLDSFWWPTVFPGVAIFLVVMSLNFLGDWLRDRLDPRLRQID